MTPECFSLLHILNKITTVQLKIQFRMVNEICAVSNVVLHGNIRTRIMPPGREQTKYTANDEDSTPIIIRDLLNDFQFNDAM